MHNSSAPMLRSHLVFASRNLDETLAFLQDKEFFLDVHPRDAATLKFVAHAAYLPGSYIGYVHYGSAATVRVPPNRKRDDFWIHFPLRGSSEVTNASGSFTCNPARSSISSPDGHVMRSEAASARVTLSISKATMISHLAALLGEAPLRALQFVSDLDLESPHGFRLRRQVSAALADLDEPGAEPLSPVMRGMYEQLIVTSMLLGQPNNFSAALQRLANHVAPGDVKRATEYIEAHLHLPLTLADVAKAAGVPGRTLLEHFREHRGVSPMRYMRDARFGRVRDALLAPREEQSVTQIAEAWGFSHLGRFATEYRARFGETPSETHRRGRSRRA
jgi:AraC-like DNA-binding protein